MFSKVVCCIGDRKRLYVGKIIKIIKTEYTEAALLSLPSLPCGSLENLHEDSYINQLYKQTNGEQTNNVTKQHENLHRDTKSNKMDDN